MRRAVVVLLVLLLCAAAASASQDNWRMFIRADNGTGLSPGSIALGVYPTSVDGLDAQDGVLYTNIPNDTPGTGTHITSPIDGQFYYKNIKAPAVPKTWDLYVAASLNSSATVIRLQAYTLSSYPVPTSTFGGSPVEYYIEMMDNRGVAGAPANGTRWQLPVPTAYSTYPYWTIPTNLPVLKLSARSNAAMLAEGYKLRFIEQVVPEPSSLLALGTGLAGLVGMIRRRK